MDRETLISQAKDDLQIKVPIYRVDVDDSNLVTFYLYGGNVLIWAPDNRKRVDFHADDLTDVDGIGRVTAGRLRSFGIITVNQLASALAEDPDLDRYDVPRASLSKIRHWLQANGHDLT